MANPRSTAQVVGHPIHPMLVPFPIVFFVSVFVCDLAFWQSGATAWTTAGIWLLGAGLVTAALTAIAGLLDFAGEQRIRDLSDAWWHAGANIVAVLIELYNFYIRYANGSSAVLPTGLILSLIVVCLLFFSGWKGAELVFRHRVGVNDSLGNP
jgi:Predicted membrane protein